MSDTVQVFTFEGVDVRVVDRNGKPWFVLADACRAVGIGNPRQAARRLASFLASRQAAHKMDTVDGIEGIADPQVRALGIVDLFGLCGLVVAAEKGKRRPAATRFWHWVFEEPVLAIRRTGRFRVAAPEETLEERGQRAEEGVRRAIQELEPVVARQRARRAEGLPEVDAADRVFSDRFMKWITSEVLPSLRRFGIDIVPAPEETREALVLRVFQAQQAQLDACAQEQEELERDIAESDRKIAESDRKIAQRRAELDALDALDAQLAPPDAKPRVFDYEG